MDGGGIIACCIFIYGDGMNRRQNEREPKMNSTNNQTATGSAVTMAQHVANELRKSGTRAWAGLPTPEEMEQLRAEKAERDFEALKRREEAKDRKMAELKERTKRTLRGEIADE
jgi:hypothetical protein